MPRPSRSPDPMEWWSGPGPWGKLVTATPVTDPVEPRTDDRDRLPPVWDARRDQPRELLPPLWTALRRAAPRQRRAALLSDLLSRGRRRRSIAEPRALRPARGPRAAPGRARDESSW